MIKNLEELRKNENSLTLQEIKSRLVCMDVDFDPNIKIKNFYVELYNSAIKNEQNRRKISNKLLADAARNDGNKNSKLRSRDTLEYNHLDNDGKLAKLMKNEANIESSNDTVKPNKNFLDMFSKSRENLNLLNEERYSSTNLNLNQNNSDENPDISNLQVKRIPLIIPKLIRSNTEVISKLSRLVNEINLTINPYKSVYIFRSKANPNKYSYINITIIMICTITFILVTYIYLNPKLVKPLLLAKEQFPTSDNANLNLILIGLCFLPLVIYAIETHLNYENIATEVYNDVKIILEEIKNNVYENFLSEDKIISNFSEKYEMHLFTFEQNILPRIRQLVYEQRKIKIIKIKDKNVWKFK